MKIQLWIVTYNNSQDLYNNLRSLYDNSGTVGMDLSVIVINNHTNYNLAPEFQSRVRTLHNNLRSDNSLGHLARNWNQALVNGFGNLDSPQCDILITSQDDVIWQPNWYKKVLEYTKTYSFITQGHGDAVCIYKPEAVRRIGLWDERYTPSFYHDGDYLLRAVMHNRDHSSINDPGHGRIFQPLSESLIFVPTANSDREHFKHLSLGRARIPHLVWMHKWDVNPIHWTDDLLENPPKTTKCLNYVTYPHFEMSVENLAEKNYLI